MARSIQLVMEQRRQLFTICELSYYVNRYSLYVVSICIYCHCCCYYYYYYYYYYDHHCYKLFSAFLWWTSQDDDSSAGSFHCWRNQFRSVPLWMEANKFSSILWWNTRVWTSPVSWDQSMNEEAHHLHPSLGKKKIFHCWWKEICFEGELSGIILEH